MYACRFEKNGDVFITDGSVSEKWGTAGRDADDYDVQMSEAEISGHYIAPFDADGNIEEGTYRIAIFDQKGLNPVNSDIHAIAQGEIFWDGLQEVTIVTINTTISTPVVVEHEVPTVGVTPDTGDTAPGGGAGSSPGGGAEGGGGSVVSGGSSGC